MFDRFPTYPRYRTLRLSTPRQVGQDVYALQTALWAVTGTKLVFDGVFGPKTSDLLRQAQIRLNIVSDALAGQETQIAIVKKLAKASDQNWGTPNGLVFGQCMHESGCRLGNYSSQRADGTFDAGVAQRNTKFTPQDEGFNVPKSIDLMGMNDAQYFDKYLGVKSLRRRWELVSGAWNAPAFANWLAREAGAKTVRTSETAKPSLAQIETLEAYMSSATTYMKL